jgi:hypothetical protein
MSQGLVTTLFGVFGGQLRKRRNVRDIGTTLERMKTVVENWSEARFGLRLS